MEKMKMSTPARLMIGFVAGALSHLIFQGVLGALLHAGALIAEPVWRMAPVPPLGIPTLANNMVWDGLWGIIYAMVEPHLTRRAGRYAGGALFGFAPLLVFWFVVLPLKGHSAGDGFIAGEVMIDILFDTLFGLGIAILYRAAFHLRRPAERVLQYAQDA